jgi:hypothetical protein
MMSSEGSNDIICAITSSGSSPNLLTGSMGVVASAEVASAMIRRGIIFSLCVACD